MTLILAVIVIALVFEFINGFHDTANSIATVVSTKVLTPRLAIVLAAVTNLVGALWGTAVAKTIASGLVQADFVNPNVILCALLGAIIWNLLTWWVGLPSSSSHALVGGLCGAVLAAAHGNWSAIIWSDMTAPNWWERKGVLWKVVVPMLVSPIMGFIIGMLVMTFLYFVLSRKRPSVINSIFGKLQVCSSAAMGFMHGTNDAQKTMGIIALLLVSASNSNAFADLPSCLSFLKISPPAPGAPLEIALWIKLLCAVTMSLGTAVGGWRIIKTLGHKMVKLQPIHGFAAETSSSIVIFSATFFGIPVSTTHNISAAILGVGAAKRFSAIKWSVVERMVWAWVLTLPIAGLCGYLAVKILGS